MRITKHIYKRLQEVFPDLFIEAAQSKTTSTLFSEFLPGAALSDPNGNPWGQYGNHEIPPKRKTIIVSFNNIEDMFFSELREIDETMRFLKRAGFDVLIPVEDELQDYDMQLFDREKIAGVGNKSRAEIQKMAIEKKISADDLFFIDDIKKELDERYLNHFLEKLHALENEKLASEQFFLMTDSSKKLPIPDSVGIVYFKEKDKKKSTEKRLVLREIKLEESKEIPSGLEISHMLRARGMKNEESIHQGLRIFDLIKKTGVSFPELMALQPELRSEVIANYYEICELIDKVPISFHELISLTPSARKLICNLNKIKSFIKGDYISFSVVSTLTPSLQLKIIDNYNQICELVEAGVPFAELVASEQILEKTIKYSYEIKKLIQAGVSFSELLSLEPKLLLQITYHSGVYNLIDSKTGFISFSELIALEEPLRRDVIRQSFQIATLLNNVAISLPELLSVDRTLRSSILQLSEEIKYNFNEGLSFEQYDMPYDSEEYGSRLKEYFDNDDVMREFIALIKEKLKNVSQAKQDEIHNTHSNLYCVSIETTLSKQQIDFLYYNGKFIETMSVNKLGCSNSYFFLDDEFEKLSFLEIEGDNLMLNFDAPKLTLLKFSLSENLSPLNFIFINKLPFLNRLEINFGFSSKKHTERQYPQLASVKNKNLTELLITGNIPSPNFIELLLSHSPKLRLLELFQVSVAEKDIQELQKRFPNLTIRASFQYNDKDALPTPAAQTQVKAEASNTPKITDQSDIQELLPAAPQTDIRAPVPSVPSTDPLLDIQELNASKTEPHAVYQSVAKISEPVSLHDKQSDNAPIFYSTGHGSVSRTYAANELKKCLSDIFEWSSLKNVAEKKINTHEFHHLTHEKYNKVLELQTVMKIAQDEMQKNPIHIINHYKKVLEKLKEIKDYLENNDADYKLKLFGEKKFGIKKGFYDRVTKAIKKIKTQIKQFEAIPYLQSQMTLAVTRTQMPVPASPTSQHDSGKKNSVYTHLPSNLTSDFDTEHHSETTFTMQEACRHLSTTKEKRFPYTRENIYTLDSDALFSVIHSHVFIEYHPPEYQKKFLIDDTHDFYAFMQKIDLKASDSCRITGLSAHDVLLQLALNNMPLTSDDITITKDELGFYYLKANKPLKGALEYVIDIPAESKTIWSAIPDDLRSIIKKIQQFPSSQVSELSDADCFPKKLSELSTEEKYDVMFDKEKGACRHRVAIFLHKLNSLKKACPDHYQFIEARGVERGGVHINIEISTDSGNTFEMLELGGYETHTQYIPSELPPVQFSTPESDAPLTPDELEIKKPDVPIESSSVETPTKESDEALKQTAQKTDKPYIPIKLPPLQFSTKRTKEEPKPLFTDVLTNINHSSGVNTFLCLQNTSDIYTCLSHIRQKSSERPVFYIDSPDQLRTSLKRLKLSADRSTCEIAQPPTGLFYDFLIAHQKTSSPPIIVINWENFKPSDIVQFNAVIDVANRRVDNTPIPAGATNVGLHSRNEKMMDLLVDSSFLSRHATGGIHDLATQSLPAISQSKRSIAESSKILKINLHRSSRWQDMLIGKAFVDGNKLRWQDGELLELIDHPDISRVEFINPPRNDRAFNNFIADLRAGLPIIALNQTLPINREIDVTVSENPEFTQGVTITLTRCDALIRDAFIINSSTFEQCLHGKKITDDGLLFAEKGLIEAHANSVLKLCVCDTLSDSQWSLLLDYLKKYNVTVDLSVTRDVTLPSGIQWTENPLAANSNEMTSNGFIISDDVEYSVAKLQSEFSSPAKVIDLSEVGLDDLFFKTEHNTTNAGFIFKKQFSDVWKALVAGETVILKGNCSTETLNFLSTLYAPDPYFYCEGQKQRFSGRLIVVAEESIKPPSWLNPEKQCIALSDKRRFLALPEESTDQNKPFIQLQLEKQKYLNAIAENEVISLSDLFEEKTALAISSITGDHSLNACLAFERKRLDSVKEVLSYSPFVLLEGAPGVGKSYFMRSLQLDPSIKFYREDEIEKWASEAVPYGVQKILFRDEINLRGIDCAQDRDLLNNPHSIYANGKYYQLSGNCKIMYAQNPLDYGGDRHEPKLFQDLPECKIVFEQMSPAFILHRILKPIFETTFKPPEFSETKAETLAAEIIKTDFESMRSIRDLQTKAIFQCAKEKARQKALSEDQEVASDLVNRDFICLGKNNFICTPSRFAAYDSILTLLNARTFKQNLPETAPDGARFNGVNGMVLQGQPGIGKSEFITSVLDSENYFSHDFKPNPHDEAEKIRFASALNAGSIYYRLPASIDIELKIKILDEAFQNGALLIIDEIDSCPLLEDRLNAYLTGEDIKGNRPNKPGFTLLSTGNGAGEKGRRVLPAPLLSRMIAQAFNEYPRDDLFQILEAKYIPPIDPIQTEALSHEHALRKDMIAFLIDGFLVAEKTNKDAPPTFRDLDVVTKKYFEDKFKKYCEWGLSNEQHEFMLVYRNHPKIRQLFDRFESGELIAKEITLTDMLELLQAEDLLKTAVYQYGLFHKKNRMLPAKEDAEKPDDFTNN